MEILALYQCSHCSVRFFVVHVATDGSGLHQIASLFITSKQHGLAVIDRIRRDFPQNITLEGAEKYTREIMASDLPYAALSTDRTDKQASQHYNNPILAEEIRAHIRFHAICKSPKQLN